jgi:hypothetical protein
MPTEIGTDMRAGPVASPSRRRLRLAAMPLLGLAVAVSLLSALSGGPTDALAGLPMLVLSIVLVLGGSAGVETLVALVAERCDRSVETPVRRRFHRFSDHAPAWRLLVAGRPLRGPPFAAAA